MFIVITGLDGSGTSTIAKKMGKIDPGGIVLKTPSIEYSQREMIDMNVRETSQYAHYLYYLSSVVYMSEYITKNIDYKNKNVYCVRYLIDTVVSHRVAGLQVNLDYEKNGILKPDYTIFVSLDEKIRQERISKRGKSVLDKLLDDDDRRSKFLKEFNTLLPSENTIYIDNGISLIDDELKNIYLKNFRR